MMTSRNTLFGRYELRKEISSGGMGVVSLATLSGPAGFQKVMVIKRVLDECARESGFIEMFLTEARLSAKLTHKNIVQIFDLGSIDDTYFLAMEYVPGRSVSELIQWATTASQAIPAGHIVDIVSQLCDGLSYAHSAADAHGPLNIVHRDVSPRNILLSYGGDVKIIDFGVAKSRLQLTATQAGVVKGKLSYMSPEQSTGELIDKRTDIFAVGVCLYELCTLTHPFRGPNQLATLEAIRNHEPPPIESVAPKMAMFAPIIARALAKDRRSRYADCTELRRDLQELLIFREVEVPRQTLAAYLQRVFAIDLAADNAMLRELTEVDAVTYSTGVHSVSAVVPRAPSLGATDGVPSAPPAAQLLVTRLARAFRVRESIVIPLFSIPLIAVATTPVWYAAGWLSGQRPGAYATISTADAPPAAPPTFAAPMTVEPTRESLNPLPSDSIPPSLANGSDGGTAPSSATTAGVNEPRRAKRVAPVFGLLRIATEPPVDVFQDGRRLGARVTLSGRGGTLVVGTGQHPERDPFAVRISYRRSGADLILRVDSKPWSIVQTGTGDGLGRTPLDLTRSDGQDILELTNPQQGRRLRMTLNLRRTPTDGAP